MDEVQTVPIDSTLGCGFVCGQGPAMVALNAIVGDLACSDIPVLILGESGTGKDAYARLIHRLSQASSPFWKINCSAITPDDFQAQVQKAFRRQLDSEAPGSLYLDNVQDLDPTCQRVLLSNLPDEENTARSLRSRPRLLSSTSGSLQSEVEAGRFRRELYFRLNGASLRLPVLRERKEDVPALMEHFLEKHCNVLKKKVLPLSKRALQTLLAYNWPGNIRELENFTRKMAVFDDVQMALNDLQATRIITHSPEIAPGASLKMAARAASRKAEREMILQALERTHWNRKRAARDLQISYKSLLYKIKQIGVPERKQEC